MWSTFLAFQKGFLEDLIRGSRGMRQLLPYDIRPALIA